jgi:hypothetical protein
LSLLLRSTVGECPLPAGFHSVFSLVLPSALDSW